ncbi:hypothetical protein H6F93_27300 [Leptolyngbya sp. FACHB-671]|uniref:hypothetical protein n=1 Tax=Leptolyngbya sp. FACHB-671 TaxID=2692812 RepID=UPI00168618D7|nr:hypothetical protein [Leptolyngbya sp. FACHB-671]MBD2071177.1 hypothetical protein [Leptolyngbya sp. FACHB-671]
MQCDRQRVNFRLLGAASAVLAGTGAVSPALASELIAQVNSCPGVFYEEPFNNTVAPPQGCPPNAASSQVPGDPETLVAPDQAAPSPSDTTSFPPTPEQIEEPVTAVIPVNGAVSVRLINSTAAVIRYQVIEDTELRSLAGDSEVTLQQLATPITITFYREDRGLLTVTPVAIAEPGVLEVTLDETTDLGEDETALVIQETGSVFLN